MPFSPHPSVAAVLVGAGPATDKAYRAVLDAVVSGSARSGELLSEVDVAAVLGMSRTPVRAAFVRLAGEGLLTLYPRRGAVVVPPDDRQDRDLLETRLMFETTAVGWAVAAGLPAGLADELRNCLSGQDATAEDDVLGFARADRALHEAVVTAAGNTVAGGLFAQTGPRLLRLIHRVAERDVGTRRRLAAEHARLVDLLLAGNAPGYTELLRTHVQEAHGVH